MMRGLGHRERTLIGAVGFMEVVRMLGIFLILPVLEVYSSSITRSNVLIAIAFGSYGLASAIFQTPFGYLSDKIGRKPAIMIGMVPFIVGNLITFADHSIVVLILGRFLAGSGAIGSVATAMVQENVPQERRNAAMALIGIPVGISFLLGLLLGPAIGYAIGFNYLFLLSAVLGIVATIVIMIIRVPDFHTVHRRRGIKLSRSAFYLSVAGFAISFLMVSFFYYFQVFVTDVILQRNYVLSLFIPGIMGGSIAVGIAGRIEGKATTGSAVASILIMILAVPILFSAPLRSSSLLIIEAGSVVFFLGYSLYEIVFPTAVTKVTARESYGSNLGLFNTFQHLGQFAGGMAAGLLIGIRLTRSDQLFTMWLLIAVSLVALILSVVVHFSDRGSGSGAKGLSDSVAYEK